ncbi:hypothetical protein AXF42_Ash006769 [Apostasia shenzhenica]|uniref:Uncharacterized protein n=1 Tax=Apostasia shenzhenica TaxID=1088818 RepID=A0A2I0AJ39_9ASPA|nr:hypothetical protein AXF42_Ash006769 [Apostasia shenzhenica]
MASKGSHLLLLSHAVILLLCASTATTGAQPQEVTGARRSIAGIAAVFTYNAIAGGHLRFYGTLSAILVPHAFYLNIDLYHVTVIFVTHLSGLGLPTLETSVMTFAVPHGQYPSLRNITRDSFEYTAFVIYHRTY